MAQQAGTQIGNGVQPRLQGIGEYRGPPAQSLLDHQIFLSQGALEQTGPAFRLAEPASAEGFPLLSSTVAVSIGVAQTDNMALHDISVPRFVYFFVPITYQFS